MFNFEARVLIGCRARVLGSHPIERVPQSRTFFPGQLAFCKKAVEGLAARRIF